MKVKLLSLFFLLIAMGGFAQHNHQSHPSEESSQHLESTEEAHAPQPASLGETHAPHHDKPHLRLSFALAQTYLHTETSTGKELTVLPSFGLDVEYWHNGLWGIGLHNDLELATFTVIEDEDNFVEREFPVLITLDGLIHPVGGLILFGGPGIEFESTQNYWVLRGGAEYEIPIGHHWDFAPIVFYDARKGAYDTFTIGLSAGLHIGG